MSLVPLQLRLHAIPPGNGAVIRLSAEEVELVRDALDGLLTPKPRSRPMGPTIDNTMRGDG